MTKTAIFNSKPNPLYIYNVTFNFHTGSITPRQIHSQQDLLFKRVPNSVKSEIIFTGADMREGFLNFYLIVLDDFTSFIFATGTAIDTHILVGGNFLSERGPQTYNHKLIDWYFEKQKSALCKAYAAKDGKTITDKTNGLINDMIEIFK